MRLQLFTYFLLSCMMVLSCQSNQQKEVKPQESVGNHVDSLASKHIPFSGEFHQITNMSSINIIYKQGPCSIKVEGPAELVSMVSADVDSDILLLSLASERNQDIIHFQESRSNLTAYVSSPNLRMLAVCGSGAFTCKGLIEAEDVHIGSLRNGPIYIDSLKCNNLKYEINGTGRDSLAHVTCSNDALLMSSAEGYLTISEIAVGGELTFDDNSASTIKAKGKTTSLVIINQGSGLSSFEGEYTKKEIHQGKDAKVEVLP